MSMPGSKGRQFQALWPGTHFGAAQGCPRNGRAWYAFRHRGSMASVTAGGRCRRRCWQWRATWTHCAPTGRGAGSMRLRSASCSTRRAEPPRHPLLSLDLRSFSSSVRRARPGGCGPRGAAGGKPPLASAGHRPMSPLGDPSGSDGSMTPKALPPPGKRLPRPHEMLIFAFSPGGRPHAKVCEQCAQDLCDVARARLRLLCLMVPL